MGGECTEPPLYFLEWWNEGQVVGGPARLAYRASVRLSLDWPARAPMYQIADGRAHNGAAP